MNTSVLRAAIAALLVAGVACGGERRGGTADAPAGGSAVAVAGFASHASARPRDPAASPLRHVPGEILVRFRPSSTRSVRTLAVEYAGAEVAREFQVSRGLALVRVKPGRSFDTALARLGRSGDVVYAEPNYVLRAFRTPDDPHFPEQWALSNAVHPGTDIGAPAAWDLTTGTRDVVVAVVDTGIDYTHPDLAANVWSNPGDCDGDGNDDDGDGYVDDCHGIDAITGTGDPMDDEGHGTHVAGTIGAVGNDALGVAGVSWAVTILPCKYLDANGEGTTANAIECLDYVTAMKDRGVNVVAINASWGGGMYSRALLDAIEAQRQRGILFVAAAGNEGIDNDYAWTFPCAYPSSNIICVAASTADGSMAGYSNRGPTTVHLEAPGDEILSTFPGGGYAVGSGTSMAAPHVSGTVALVKARFPNADWRAVRNRILAGGSSAVFHSTITQRRLDAYGALTCQGRELIARVQPVGALPIYSSPGVPIALGAIHVVCDQPGGGVTVTVLSGGVPTGETVTLLDDGVGEDDVAGDGVYHGTWTPLAGGVFDLAFPSVDVVTVHVDPDLQPGFPVKVWHDAGTYQGGPGNNTLVGDIDGDGQPEVLVSGTAVGPLYAFKDDGRTAPGWPVLEGGAGVAYAGLGKLSAAGGAQVAVGYFSQGGAAYDGAGALLPGWPIDAPFGFVSPPMLADVDGDGFTEPFLVTLLRSEGGRQNPSGPISDWTPAAADLFGDGQVELAYFTDEGNATGALRVARADGSAVDGFPVTFHAFLNAYPAVGDVDGDGTPEIVLQPDANVLVFSRSGVLERTIPVAGTFSYDSAPALADLDGDGVLDIVVQSDFAVNAVHGDGTAVAGWPVTAELGWAANSAPVVGDLDGDGLPEVAVVSQFPGSAARGWVHVFDRHGSSLPRFPKELNIGAGSTPAIADIDGDGRNELLVTGDFWDGYPGYFDKLWVFDLGGPPHGPVQWAQFMGNAQHTGTSSPAAAPRRTFHRLTVARTGSGVVFAEPFGIDCGTVCSRTYPAGTQVTLTASAQPGFQLSSWTGACGGAARTCSVILDSDKSVGAEFSVPRQLLTVSRTGAGAGSVTSTPSGIDCGTACSAAYDRGTSVTLTATAASGSAFAGWSGACGGTGATCVVGMLGDQSATARFDPIPHAVSVTLAGTGTGTVTSSPDGISCGATCQASFPPSTSVTLSASPAAGSAFVGWGGACTGAGACVLDASADRSVTARFDDALDTHTISVARTGTGGGTVTSSPAGISCGTTCQASFPSTATVTLTASPLTGSTFAGWSGACAGASPTCQLAGDADRQATATFTANGGGGGGGGGCSTGLGASTLLTALAWLVLLRPRSRRRTGAGRAA